MEEKRKKRQRTPEQKEARRLRRAQKRANLMLLKNKFKNTITTINEIDTQWSLKPTSDGLPYSESIDNPDSLRAQLKRMEEYQKNQEQQKTERQKKELENYRRVKFAGWTGITEPTNISFE